MSGMTDSPDYVLLTLPHHMTLTINGGIRCKKSGVVNDSAASCYTPMNASMKRKSKLRCISSSVSRTDLEFRISGYEKLSGTIYKMAFVLIRSSLKSCSKAKINSSK
jgi:hypothetical protein